MNATWRATTTARETQYASVALATSPSAATNVSTNMAMGIDHR
jgi:thiamine pyrophosphate-dependent acetolactate synthase large subunit-like protein